MGEEAKGAVRAMEASERKDRVSHRRLAWEALAPRIPMERPS